MSALHYDLTTFASFLLRTDGSWGSTTSTVPSYFHFLDRLKAGETPLTARIDAGLGTHLLRILGAVGLDGLHPNEIIAIAGQPSLQRATAWCLSGIAPRMQDGSLNPLQDACHLHCVTDRKAQRQCACMDK